MPPRKTLNKRERILAAVTGTLLLLFVGKFLFSAVSGRLDSLQARRDALVAEVQKKKARVARGRRATERMTDWQRRSLPVDREMARSLYQNWLLGLVDKVKLHHARVESGEARSRRDIYWRLSFTIHGRGSLEQLTQLLWDFYSAGHLQQIRRLSIKPIEGSSELDLALSIEALSLPGADNLDELSAERPAQPLPGKLANYRESIVQRNLFGSYVPPPPPPPPVRPKPKAPPPPPPPARFRPYEARGRNRHSRGGWPSPGLDKDANHGRTIRAIPGRQIQGRFGRVQGRPDRAE